MEQARRPRPGTIVMAAGGAAAALLYAWFLSVDLASVVGPGDAVVGQAYEALTALLLLWCVLLVLVIVDRVLGGPSWVRRAGYVLVPLAGVATFFATDYPGSRLCRFILLALPLLTGAYVALGRLPRREAGRVQAAVLLPMAVLSAYAIRLFLR
jgi:hypothetical protein